MVKGYVDKRFANLPDHEREDIKAYFKQIFMREGSTEYAIFVCFKPGLFAHNPLEAENILGTPDITIPMSFYYGDRDWMDIKGG